MTRPAATFAGWHARHHSHPIRVALEPSAPRAAVRYLTLEDALALVNDLNAAIIHAHRNRPGSHSPEPPRAA